MQQVISVPPKVIYSSPQTEPTNGSMQTLPLQMNFTPTTNIFPIHRRIKNQTFIHNTPPNTPAETTPEKEVVSIFLTSKTKETQGRTRVTPSAHLLLFSFSSFRIFHFWYMIFVQFIAGEIKEKMNRSSDNLIDSMNWLTLQT